MATSKPQTDLVAEVHVAGPLEQETRRRNVLGKAKNSTRSGQVVEVALTPGEVEDVVLVQRCLRCDELLGIVGSSAGATWKIGTRIGLIYADGRTRLYVLDRRGLAEGEEDCVDRIGW